MSGVRVSGGRGPEAPRRGCQTDRRTGQRLRAGERASFQDAKTPANPVLARALQPNFLTLVTRRGGPGAPPRAGVRTHQEVGRGRQRGRGGVRALRPARPGSLTGRGAGGKPSGEGRCGEGRGRGGTRGGAACVRVPRRRGPCGVLAVARLAQSRVDAECSPSALPWEGKVRAAPRRCIRAASGRPGPPLPSHRPRGLLVRRSRGSSWASGLRGNETGQVGPHLGSRSPGLSGAPRGSRAGPQRFCGGWRSSVPAAPSCWRHRRAAVR